MDRLWKIEKLAQPTPSYAADAIEIIEGEPMRRVSLSALDLSLYEAHKNGQNSMETFAALQSLPIGDIMASLRRLGAAGLVQEQPPLAS